MVLLKREHVPNAITLFRFLFLPFIIITGIAQMKWAFMALFVVHIFLDLLDGYLARRLKVESDLGRRLDTIVDFIVIVTGIILFIHVIGENIADVFATYAVFLFVPLGAQVLLNGIAYRYMKTFASLHLYSGKSTTAVVLAFMIAALSTGLKPIYIYIVSAMSMLYHIEAILIYLLRKEKTDEKTVSIFQLRKTRKLAQ